jgi:ribosomal protein S18 acetylase RimI-like enzyme
MSTKPHKIDFMFCNYENPLHQKALIELINHYRVDPMGGCDPITVEQACDLIKGLSEHTSSFVMFVKSDDVIAGLATCFINFSTFKVTPYINIHDLIVQKEYRNTGLGGALLQKIIAIARERNYCKVNLEVRTDNAKAQKLYHSLGFRDTSPPMYFWTKFL